MDLTVLVIAGVAHLERIGLQINTTGIAAGRSGRQQVTRPGRQAGFIGAAIFATQHGRDALQELLGAVGMCRNQANFWRFHSDVAGPERVRDIALAQYVIEEKLLLEFLVVTQ
ncbi:hypothetical protein D3C76_800110 [compost metagenome]